MDHATPGEQRLIAFHVGDEPWRAVLAQALRVAMEIPNWRRRVAGLSDFVAGRYHLCYALAMDRDGRGGGGLIAVEGRCVGVRRRLRRGAEAVEWGPM